MAVNWEMGIVQQDPGQTFLEAFQRGQEMRRKQDAQNALSAYARNPDAAGLDGLAQYDPKFVIEQKEAMRKRGLEQQKLDLTGRAAQGDTAALAQLAGVDLEAWMKLDDRALEGVKRSTDFLGQTGLAISQLPPDQQPAAYTAAVQRAAALGMKVPPQFQQYSPENVRAAISGAGIVEKLIAATKPHILTIPHGGSAMAVDQNGQNVRTLVAPNPGGVPQGAPVGGSQAPVQITSMDDYNRLPPGAAYIDPQGNHRTKAGGPTQPASGGFPGAESAGILPDVRF